MVYSDLRVSAAGGEVGAIRTIGYTRDACIMVAELGLVDFLASGDVPDLDGAVSAAEEEILAIGRIDDGIDGSEVALQREDLTALTVGDEPDLDGLVAAARDEVGAVRRETDAHDFSLMTGEFARFTAVLVVPEANCHVGGGGREEFACVVIIDDDSGVGEAHAVDLLKVRLEGVELAVEEHVADFDLLLIFQHECQVLPRRVEGQGDDWVQSIYSELHRSQLDVPQLYVEVPRPRRQQFGVLVR